MVSKIKTRAKHLFDCPCHKRVHNKFWIMEYYVVLVENVSRELSSFFFLSSTTFNLFRIQTLNVVVHLLFIYVFFMNAF